MLGRVYVFHKESTNKTRWERFYSFLGFWRSWFYEDGQYMKEYYWNPERVNLWWSKKINLFTIHA